MDSRCQSAAFTIGATLLWAAMARAEAPVPHSPVAPPETNLFGDNFVIETPGTEARPDHPPAEAEKKPSPFRHTVTFGDGRQFHGELLEVTEDAVVWRRPDTREPMRFPRAQVRRIDFVKSPLAGQESMMELEVFENVQPPVPQDWTTNRSAFATLKVGGADWLFGRVTSADGQTFTVQLEDGTRLPVPRSQIEWLYFCPGLAPGFGYSGSALDFDLWTPPEMKVEVSGATAKITGTHWFGFTAGMPIRFEVSFEVPAEREDGLHLWLQPSDARVNTFEPGTVEVLFSGKEISRQIMNDHNQLQTSPLPPEAREDKGPPSYRILYDGVGKRIHVWRNRREIGDWTLGSDNGGLVGVQVPRTPGEAPSEAEQSSSGIVGICFERAGQADLEINHLRVQPWNGILPGHDTPEASLDILSRHDSAPVTGKLESITDKSLVISGITRPHKPGTFLQFPSVPAPLASVEAKLRLWHGALSARHLEIRDGRIRCATTFASAVDIPTKAIRTILFSNPPESAPEAEDVLVFQNGDELTGHAVSASLPGPVRWKSAYGPEFEFAGEALAGIRVATGAGHAPAAAAIAELRTGEQLRGRIVNFDGRELKLQHDHLGVITLNRDRLARVYPNSQNEIMEGADQPEEWTKPTVPEGSPGSLGKAARLQLWTYLDGIYVLNPAAGNFARLARRIQPTLERFEVRAEITGAHFASGLAIVLLKNGQEIFTAGASYEGQEVMVLNPSGHNHAREIPPEEDPPTKRRRSMRLFADLKAGTFDVLCDGKSMGHYELETKERKTAAQYTVQICPAGPLDMTQGAVSENILSGLWIGPWVGPVPKAGLVRPVTTILANGDVTTGTPRNVHDGKWTLKSDLGTIEVPADKVLAVDFSAEPIVEPAAGRIRLRDGTKLDVDRFAWDGRTLAAHNTFLGDFQLPAEDVAELIYHPARFRPPIDEAPRSPFARDPDKIPLHNFGNP